MRKINISVSNLQAFQHWIDGEYDYAEMDALEFCQSLIKPFKKKPQMMYGTAVHEYLEKGNLIAVEGGIISEETDIFIPWSELHDARKVRTRFESEEGWEMEPWAPSIKIEDHDFTFKIRGRVDVKNILTNTLIDYKIKQPWNGFLKSGYSMQYMDSWQWKYYLWMTGFDTFWYLIFLKQPHKKAVGNQMIDVFKLKCIEPIKLYRYNELETDCKDFFNEFIEALRNMNFLEKLYDHQEEKRQVRAMMPNS